MTHVKFSDLFTFIHLLIVHTIVKPTPPRLFRGTYEVSDVVLVSNTPTS